VLVYTQKSNPEARCGGSQMEKSLAVFGGSIKGY
jgi:hypothetical protein